MKQSILLVLLFLCATPAVAQTALYIAAKSGDIQQVKELIAEGANLEESNSGAGQPWGGTWDDHEVGLTPIFGAIYSNKVEVIDFLIEKGANLNAEGNNYWDEYPLIAAVRCGFWHVVDTLIQHGAYKGYHEILHTLLAANQEALFLKMFQYRERENFKVEKDVLSELLITATRSTDKINLHIFTLLIDLGADVNYVGGSRGEFDPGSPLHQLVESRLYGTEQFIKNKIDMIKILVSRGANLQALNRRGERPFEVAARCKHRPEIIGALRPK